MEAIAKTFLALVKAILNFTEQAQGFTSFTIEIE
jgi:hypothetical protein